MKKLEERQARRLGEFDLEIVRILALNEQFTYKITVHITNDVVSSSFHLWKLYERSFEVNISQQFH